jgi:hypothetical protein
MNWKHGRRGHHFCLHIPKPTFERVIHTSFKGVEGEHKLLIFERTINF